MFEKRPERMFFTEAGYVNLKLFDAKVGWNIRGSSVELFAWGLSGRKINRLGLSELSLIKLNREYHEWFVTQTCNKCPLKINRTCSGLIPTPFDHPAEGGVTKVMSYDANMNQKITYELTFDGVKRMINRMASCKPIYWA
jgi:hypothetical protein